MGGGAAGTRACPRPGCRPGCSPLRERRPRPFAVCAAAPASRRSSARDAVTDAGGGRGRRTRTDARDPVPPPSTHGGCGAPGEAGSLQTPSREAPGVARSRGWGAQGSQCVMGTRGPSGTMTRSWALCTAHGPSKRAEEPEPAGSALGGQLRKWNEAVSRLGRSKGDLSAGSGVNAPLRRGRSRRGAAHTACVPGGHRLHCRWGPGLRDPGGPT